MSEPSLPTPIPDGDWTPLRPWVCPIDGRVLLQDTRPTEDGDGWIGFCPQHSWVLGIQRDSRDPENLPEEAPDEYDD